MLIIKNIKIRADECIRVMFARFGHGRPSVLWLPCPRSAIAVVVSLNVVGIVKRHGFVQHIPGQRPLPPAADYWLRRGAFFPDGADESALVVSREFKALVDPILYNWRSLWARAGCSLEDGMYRAAEQFSNALMDAASESNPLQRDSQAAVLEAATCAIRKLAEVNASKCIRIVPQALRNSWHQWRYRDHQLKDLYTEIGKACCCFWQVGPVVVACERFRKIQYDEPYRLHNSHGPAAVYASGEAVYYWRGERVPPYVILYPGLITLQHIESEKDARMRWFLIERYGRARYVVDSGGEVIDESAYGTLYRKRGSKHRQLAAIRVRNATVEADGSYKEYLLQVPPGIRTARQGVAWTFGLREDEYAPVVET